MREAADTLILEHYVQMTFSSQYYCPFSSSSPYFSNLVCPCTVGSGTERQHSSNGRGGLRNLFFIRTVSSHIPLVQIFWCHKQLTNGGVSFWVGVSIYTQGQTQGHEHHVDTSLWFSNVARKCFFHHKKVGILTVSSCFSSSLLYTMTEGEKKGLIPFPGRTWAQWKTSL